ncbi:MAG: acyltransferase [Verrucomicrobia bacterium]|nr:acyltransferase [Verrucomicrobiota bacterium]
MNTWPVFVTYAVVIASAWLFSKRFDGPSSSGRFTALDGLRGYLAFSVFIHHGAIWHDLLRTRQWRAPQSPVYVNLGQASVALFFMITAFLFTMKLLRGRTEPIDWFKLFASRVLRLQPLYYCVVVVTLLMVATLTRFQLQVPISDLALSLLQWATVTNNPNINGLDRTFLITAGATWTLTYEWLFYLSLPLMAVVLRARTWWPYVVGSLLFVSVAIRWIPLDSTYLRPFVGGILAAVLAHNNLIPVAVRGKIASAVALALLVVAISCFPSSYGVVPLAMLTFVFILIVGGNTLFGLLEWRPSLYMGQLTYSIYLLHGFIIFILFRLLVGYERAAEFSLAQHWMALWLCIPATLLVSTLTYRWIELPCMNCVAPLSAWWRAKMASTGRH